MLSFQPFPAHIKTCHQMVICRKTTVEWNIFIWLLIFSKFKCWFAVQFISQGINLFFQLHDSFRLWVWAYLLRNSATSFFSFSRISLIFPIHSNWRLWITFWVFWLAWKSSVFSFELTCCFRRFVFCSVKKCFTISLRGTMSFDHGNIYRSWDLNCLSPPGKCAPHILRLLLLIRWTPL